MTFAACAAPSTPECADDDVPDASAATSSFSFSPSADPDAKEETGDAGISADQSETSTNTTEPTATTTSTTRPTAAATTTAATAEAKTAGEAQT